MSLVSPYLHRSETLAPAAGVCIFPLCLTRMRLLVLLLLVTFSIALRADELTFDSYSCAITMPDGESWQRGLPQAIKDGETIFLVSRPDPNATQPDQRELFAICIIPNVPAFDVSSGGVGSIAIRTLGSFGYQSKPPVLVEGKQLSYLQLIAKRTDAPDNICVARAAIHEKTLYLLLMIGSGDVDKATDKTFTRILDTFRFLDGASNIPPLTSNPLFNKYRLGAYVCWGIAGGLVLLFSLVMYFTHRSAHYR